jgi:hypothetical protein
MASTTPRNGLAYASIGIAAAAIAISLAVAALLQQPASQEKASWWFWGNRKSLHFPYLANCTLTCLLSRFPL